MLLPWFMCKLFEHRFVFVIILLEKNKKIVWLALCLPACFQGAFLTFGSYVNWLLLLYIELTISIVFRSLRFRMITLISTLIIPDIIKTSSNNCLKQVLESLYERFICILWHVIFCTRTLSTLGYHYHC